MHARGGEVVHVSIVAPGGRDYDNDYLIIIITMLYKYIITRSLPRTPLNPGNLQISRLEGILVKCQCQMVFSHQLHLILALT